jgi:TonB family protein
VQAQLSTDYANQLELEHKGEVVRVRELVSDSKIRFDASGHLTGKWHAGRWTWHSTVEVIQVQGKDRLLKIKANRLLLNYDRDAHRFASVRAGTVEFEIEMSPDVSGKIDLAKEWNKAFLAPKEEYPLDMQPYWKPFISCIIKPDTDECKFYDTRSQNADVYNLKPTPSTWKPSYPGVYQVGGDVTPPKARSSVEPDYTDVARIAKVSGAVLLEAIIRRNGLVDVVRVVRPLGYGLEENAADALSRWVFSPATRMGSPVDVLVQVEINFRLN